MPLPPVIPLKSFNTLDDEARAAVWDEALRRLGKLAGQDDGWFVLAVHSLVEAWMNAQRPEWEAGSGRSELRDMSFRDKAAMVMRDHPAAKWHEYLELLSRSYWETTAVRHHFARLDHESAHLAATRLALLCRHAGLGSQAAHDEFDRLIQAWDGQGDMAALLGRLRELEQAAERQRTENGQLRHGLSELAARRNELECLERDIRNREAAWRKAADSRKEAEREQDKAARQQIWELKEEVRRKDRELAAHGQSLALLDLLQGMHHASRTQRDWQQTILRLSAEQEEVLSSFKPGDNFLVRGGAGTGKTLVLIKAIKAIRDDDRGGLGLTGQRRVLLLTFTKTLIRYGRYLGDLIAKGQGADDIQTVDAWMNGLAAQLEGKTTVPRYSLRELAAAGLSMPEPDTWSEIEDFIWARGLTRQEYLEAAVPRIGRRRAIRREQRAQAWETAEILHAAMRQTGVYSRYGLRLRILQGLAAGVPAGLARSEVIAVDEVQDLAPVDLRIIKLMAAESVIMAGDTQQSLYQAGFTFKSAGIDIERRARVLKRNYRNTRQIEALASAFLRGSGAASAEQTPTTAHRDGLPPRLALYAKKDGFAGALEEALDFHRRVLEYRDESVAILHPGLADADLAKLQACVASRGGKLVDIKNNDTWLDSPHIRLSTIHSAKGLDFPAVILLLPKMTVDHGTWDEDIRHGIEASLIYVGLTRALENLTVILPAETQSTCLLALKYAFGAAR
jgi:hypothetical protein